MNMTIDMMMIILSMRNDEYLMHDMNMMVDIYIWIWIWILRNVVVTYIDWYKIDLKWDMNLHMDEMCILPVNGTRTYIMRNVDCYTCG